MSTLYRCLIVLAALGLTSCASTQLVNQWSNPAYSTSPSFKRVMVIGVTKQAAIRRTFEDEFVAQLKAAGVSATPSYLYIPQDGPVGESVLKQALKEAGADGVLITRLVRVQQKTVIAPGYYAPDPGMAIHPLYTTAWNDYYEPPIVYRSEVYTSETTLYDTAKNQVVWKGTAQTETPGNVNQEIKKYAAIVISALQQKNLI
ncbi:MAG TPA: hypothetical protein VIE89_11215 [Candidatus Binatia bacterium]